jgi:hypothetical protein
MGRERNVKPKEKIIVLSYEGNHTEAIYFEELKESVRFNDELIHLHSLKRPSDDTKSAPIHVFNKLKKEVKDLYNLDKDDELWMVIDRDSWPNIQAIYDLCVAEGNFYLALSNPCFELWLLLHLKDISEYSEPEQKQIFDNCKVSAKKTFLKQHLGALLNGYNETNPKPERFLPNLDLAIDRAKNLDNPAEDYPTKIGSHIYKLAEKIIK